MNPFKWILMNQLKHFKSKQKISGFTLIELLVALLLAFLVITPLLGFMINIMDTDRKEQAKINSEQEIKAALDFIARDLQQAVFIYNADGIKAIRQQLPK
ncbi:prepilin-type cleavage/methylation domain-containing protein, partial [Fischerella thermalis CCMEE 5196]